MKVDYFLKLQYCFKAFIGTLKLQGRLMNQDQSFSFRFGTDLVYDLELPFLESAGAIGTLFKLNNLLLFNKFLLSNFLKSKQKSSILVPRKMLILSGLPLLETFCTTT